MHQILDHMRSRLSPFRPSTGLEFFALRLAQKLGDAGQVRYYASLAHEQGEEVLLGAYRRASKVKQNTMPLAARFHVELGHRAQGGSWSQSE